MSVLTPPIRVDAVRVVHDDGLHNAFTDLCCFGGRYYLTFRTCPDGHMIHPTSRIVVLASSDAVSWEHVHSFAVPGRDVRDPHFLTLGERLFVISGAVRVGPEAPAAYDIDQHQEGFCAWTEDGTTWRGPRAMEGTVGTFLYGEGEYVHPDSARTKLARSCGMDHWRNWIPATYYYPTHSTSQIMSVTGARMIRVSCQGFVDHHEDAVYEAANNEYGNTFSNEVALFAMSDGSACRVNEFRRIGHPGAVRMSLFGTEGSFEDAVGSQQFLSKGKDDAVDVSDLLTCRTKPADADRGEMGAVTSRDGTHLGAAPIHPVERLPREFAGLPNGHAGAHQFLVDDFVRSCHEGTQPPNHVWNAAAYTVPGIVAHESALRGGELLDIPRLGSPPV